MISRFIFAVTNPDNCQGGGCKVNLPDVVADQSSVQDFLTIVFGVAVAIAILVIVIAGFNITTGGGEPEKISRSKKAIIFALIGLAISLTAEFITLTVLDRL